MYILAHNSTAVNVNMLKYVLYYVSVPAIETNIVCCDMMWLMLDDIAMNMCYNVVVLIQLLVVI